VQSSVTAPAAAVLVVEDDRALRQAIVTNAERAGYAVTAVADGLAGAEAVRSRHFDVVLLDIGLPFVDGWRILSSLEGRRAPSVIVISARGEEADKVRALDMGADDYPAKPFGAACGPPPGPPGWSPRARSPSTWGRAG